MNICKIKGCPNYGSCTRHCVDNSGYTMAEFINGIDTVNTKIGEISGKYITVGIQLEHLVEPSHLLYPTNSHLDASNIFLNVFGKTPYQILLGYLDKYATKEVRDTLRDKFVGIASKKILATPIKPRTDCKVLIEGETDKFKDVNIEFIKMFTDRETGRFRGELVSEAQELVGAPRRIRLDITDYGKTYRLSYIESGIKIKKINRETIKITSTGLIRPIQFKDREVTLVVDGSYIYYIKLSCVELIGMWGKDDNIIETEELKRLSKSKAYQELMENINYISRHRRFIVPYGFLSASNIVVEGY